MSNCVHNFTKKTWSQKLPTGKTCTFPLRLLNVWIKQNHDILSEHIYFCWVDVTHDYLPQKGYTEFYFPIFGSLNVCPSTTCRSYAFHGITIQSKTFLFIGNKGVALTPNSAIKTIWRAQGVHAVVWALYEPFFGLLQRYFVQCLAMRL